MNESNLIPGFFPRAMGSLAGLMLLSGMLSMLPAEAPSADAPARADAAAMPSNVNLDWTGAESDRILEYTDENGKPVAVLLHQLLYPTRGSVDLNARIPAIIRGVEAHINRAKADGDEAFVKKTTRRVAHFAAAFAIEGIQAPEKAWAAAQFQALLRRVDKAEKQSALGVCPRMFEPGPGIKHCPV